jgi:hypothetical protein
MLYLSMEVELVTNKVTVLPRTVSLACGELEVNPRVTPKSGIWMTIDPAKYVQRAGRPLKPGSRASRIVELEAAIAEIGQLVTNDRLKMADCRTIIGKIRKILVKVSD